MSSTKVIFTYKRKRLSSCSGVDHAEACTEFSSDVQVDKHQDATKGRSESREKDPKHICHGEKFSSACSSPQVLKSSISKENNHVEESDTTDTGDMSLGSYESSGDNTFKTSTENISASLGKTKNSSEKDMDSCSPQVDGYILGASASQSMESPSEQDYLCHFGTVKTKSTTPLLTFSRRLKRKSDASSRVMFVELPIREGSEVIKESKSRCISPCSFEVISDKSRPVEESVDLKAVRNDPNTRNLLCHSRNEVLTHDNFVDSMDHTSGKKGSKEDLNVDISPVTEHTGIKTLGSITSPLLDVVETRNITKEHVRCSSNDETIVSFGDGTGVNDDHLVSHQLQASSGDSQLTTSDGWDSKLAAVRTAEQKASSGAFVIDCNVIPESELQEQASDIVHHSSIMAGTQEKDLHEGHLSSKGLEFGDIRVGVDNSLLQLPKDVCASVEAETKPRVKFLQLFPEDGISDLFPPASTVSEIVRGKDERNTTCVLDSENEHLKRYSSRTSAFLGLSLPTEPLLGQTSKHSSSVQPFQDHTARTREYIQNPATHSSLPEHVKLLFRHRMLLESINRGSRNISLDKFEPCPITWTEEELDSLWIGIRRHGRGNWHAMLLDPRLHFAPWRVTRDLAFQWEQELYKLVSEQHMPQGRYQKPPDSGNLDFDGDFMCLGTGVRRENILADTRLSLGDVYAQKEGSYFSCKVRKYSCGLFNASLDGPAMGSAPNNHFLHWVGEPIGAHSRSMEPPPHLNSTVSQMGGLWRVNPFKEPSGTSYGPRDMIGYRLSGLMAEEGRPPSGFPCAGPSKRKRGMTDNLVVIDSDASSEETISDDHNIRC